jgi:hypothetical protein
MAKVGRKEGRKEGRISRWLGGGRGRGSGGGSSEVTGPSGSRGGVEELKGTDLKTHH